MCQFEKGSMVNEVMTDVQMPFHKKYYFPLLPFQPPVIKSTFIVTEITAEIVRRIYQ